jgi:hypothetical protein
MKEVGVDFDKEIDVDFSNETALASSSARTMLIR